MVETDRGSLIGNARRAGRRQLVRRRLRSTASARPCRSVPCAVSCCTLGWTGTPLRRVTWSSRCYLVPWDDGTLLVGATVEEVGFDERTTVAGVQGLLDAVWRLVPHASTAGFRSARVGLRPATADDLPVIGASAVMPNLMYATGHFRNGVLLAPLTASAGGRRDARRQIDPMLAAVRPSRFGAL